MKILASALVAIALTATATTASAVQVFTYTGSSNPAGSTLCPFIGCGAPPGDFVITITLDDMVTNIDHLSGGSVPGLVELRLDTDNGGGLPNFTIVSDDVGNEDFAEFFINIVGGGIVNRFGFALNQAAAPAPHGVMNPDTSFTFGVVGPGQDPLGCDLATGAGCLLIENPFVTYESGPFNYQIPVPAAVWLFGSALGLLGWARRRVA